MISGGLVLLLKEDLVLFEGLGFSRGKNHGTLIGEKIIEICRIPNLIGGRCRSLLAAEE